MTDAQTTRAAFEADGFVVCRDVFSATQISALQQHTDVLTDADRAPAAAAPLLDFEATQLDGKPVVQRVRKPYEADPFFLELARSPVILDLIKPLLGENIRLHHGKINVKAAVVGSPLEWHQDWAFIPHSNQSLAIVSILIDDCPAEKGPLQLLPGSHRGPLHQHHDADGFFVGAINPDELDLSGAQAVTGAAGTLTIHHPLAVHGSDLNRGQGPRRMLFMEYAAADAWPLFYGVDWSEFNQRLVCGEPSPSVRMEANTVRMPHPTASDGQGRIYDQQQRFTNKYFGAPGGRQ
tara:strand:+ start:103 stop:981 length:879 start_codon:yes stop_codon:yes gene_type:complete